MNVRNLRNKEFADYCEYLVAFKLQELGWTVFQPLVDRYIDIVATKTVGKNKIFRTVQVKSSRIESVTGEDPESYGMTHEPKDLLHDPAHFFVWVLADNSGKYNFFILSASDFIDVRWSLLVDSTKRQFSSLLRRGEWRYGTDRMHPKNWINHKNEKYQRALKKWKITKETNEPSWTLENAILDPFLNNWKNLENSKRSNISSKSIQAQEVLENWSKYDRKTIEIWKKNNSVAYNKLKKFPDALASAKKLDEITGDE